LILWFLGILKSGEEGCLETFTLLRD
jgi:hypothetical protein